MTFVRTAYGPNAGPGLDVVHVGETTERREFVTVRSRARFAPLPVGSSLSEQLHFSDPVVLLHAPYRLTFAYAGPDRIWKNMWRGADKLPAMIRLTVRDASSERVLSVSTIAPIHVQVPSDCTQPDGNCDDKDQQAGSPDDAGGSASRLRWRGGARYEVRLCHGVIFRTRLRAGRRALDSRWPCRRWRRSSRVYLSASAQALALNDTALEDRSFGIGQPGTDCLSA